MLYDAHGRPINTQATAPLDPVQQPVNSPGPDQSPGNKDATPRPQTPIHVIAQRTDAEIQQRKTGSESANTFQRKTLRVQWFLFWATLLAFGAAAYYAHIARLQKDALVDTNKIATRSLEVSNRAYLSAKSPESVLGWAVFKIPIENYGHVPSHGFTVSINYLRMKTELSSGSVSYLADTIITREGTVIAPGPIGYVLTLMIPQLNSEDISAIDIGQQSLLIRARIVYDTGFNERDTLETCSTFDHRVKKWVSCDVMGVSIDLKEAEPRNSKKAQK